LGEGLNFIRDMNENQGFKLCEGAKFLWTNRFRRQFRPL